MAGAAGGGPEEELTDTDEEGATVGGGVLSTPGFFTCKGAEEVGTEVGGEKGGGERKEGATTISSKA